MLLLLLLLLGAMIITAPHRTHHFSTSCTALMQCYFRRLYHRSASVTPTAAVEHSMMLEHLDAGLQSMDGILTLQINILTISLCRTLPT